MANPPPPPPLPPPPPAQTAAVAAAVDETEKIIQANKNESELSSGTLNSIWIKLK